MSRKVVLYIATSLDGYIADSEGKIDWLETVPTYTEADNSYADFYQNVDTVILGRSTYDQVVNELAPDAYPYADADSYILTSRQTENSEKVFFTEENVVSLVTSLKKEAGKDIWIVGGKSVVMPLVEKDLIDEYQISTLPVLLGKGIPLFTEFNQRIVLEPLFSTLKNGIVSTTYRKTSD